MTWAPPYDFASGPPFARFICRRKAPIACTNKHNDAITYDVYNRKKVHKSCVYYISVLQQVRNHSKILHLKFEILDSEILNSTF